MSGAVLTKTLSTRLLTNGVKDLEHAFMQMAHTFQAHTFDRM